MNAEHLSMRVEKLERENRRMKAAGAALLLLLGAVAAMGQAAPVPDVLRARSFEVVDPEGKVLVSLGSDARMRSALKLYAENGIPQVVLGASSGGGGVLAFLDGTHARVTLASDPDKGAALVLEDAPKSHRAALVASKETAGLDVRDKGVTVALGAAGGNGELCIFGPDKKPSACLTRFKNGDTCLKLWDKDGKLFHCVPEGSHPESNPK